MPRLSSISFSNFRLFPHYSCPPPTLPLQQWQPRQHQHTHSTKSMSSLTRDSSATLSPSSSHSTLPCPSPTTNRCKRSPTGQTSPRPHSSSLLPTPLRPITKSGSSHRILSSPLLVTLPSAPVAHSSNTLSRKRRTLFRSVRLD